MLVTCAITSVSLSPLALSVERIVLSRVDFMTNCHLSWAGDDLSWAKAGRETASSRAAERMKRFKVAYPSKET